MSKFDLTGRAAHSALIQARAAEDMVRRGITPEVIERVVDIFYGKIRDDALLGPVFNNHIKENWPEHLRRMKLFWNALAFKTGQYGGKPVHAHIGVRGIEAQLFPVWLDLFQQTLEENITSPEAKEWFYTTAERIARSLTLSLFYSPANDDPRTSRE